MKNELKIGARVRAFGIEGTRDRRFPKWRVEEKIVFGTVEGVAGEFVAVRLDDGRAVAFLPETLEVVPAEAGAPAESVSSRGGARASSGGGCLHNVVRGGRCARCGRVVVPRECMVCGTRTTEGAFLKGNWTCGTCVHKWVAETPTRIAKKAIEPFLKKS